MDKICSGHLGTLGWAEQENIQVICGADQLLLYLF